MRRARPPRRRGELGPLTDLRALDIGERKRASGDLGAPEGAEPLQGLDAVEFADPGCLRARIAALARERRRGDVSFGDHARKTGIVEQALRRDDLARLRAR